MNTIYHNGIISKGSVRYKWLALVVTIVGTFMAILDVTIVNVAIRSIDSYFHSTLGRSEWVLTSYMLANIMMLTVSGWLETRFGFKRIYLLAIMVFVVGSLWCSVSDSLAMLVVGRFISGVGCGLLMPIGMAVVTREFSDSSRGLALGLWATGTAAGVSLGPFIGGVLVSELSWRWVFLINVPMGVLMLVAIFLVFRELPKQYSRIDGRGLLLLWSWIPLTIIILTYLNRWSWLMTCLLVLLTVSLFVCFVLHSLRNPTPIIKVRLFGNRRFALSMLSMFFDGFFVYAGAFILPLYLENSLGYTALAAGMMFIPLGVIQGITSPLSGAISRRIGLKTTILLGFSIISCYLAISICFTAVTASWLILLSLYLRGLGNGLSYSVLNNLSLTQIKRQDLSAASSISNATRQLAGVFGVAISTLILSGGAANYLALVRCSFFIVFLSSIGAIIPMFFVRIKK